jgi:hypothetical protein
MSKQAEVFEMLSASACNTQKVWVRSMTTDTPATWLMELPLGDGEVLEVDDWETYVLDQPLLVQGEINVGDCFAMYHRTSITQGWANQRRRVFVVRVNKSQVAVFNEDGQPLDEPLAHVSPQGIQPLSSRGNGDQSFLEEWTTDPEAGYYLDPKHSINLASDEAGAHADGAADDRAGARPGIGGSLE